ncbi:hypothetical protein FNAPI_11620 [Fusarium napiforme]|uniref:Metallo-beta-lactamase domain-containing protein n=1 Tax=Fusarium napiforme TaxID=42672 RepID=A0A8H5IHG3_9HYPO|nr:hypothetical protein FNAPI_11620 [Fusarium napiforme]
MADSVSSYHLNVDEGDCAIHLLKISNQLKSTVLIDGGRKSYGKAILHFMGSLQAKAENLQKFDAVIITHWDADHVEGILEFLRLQVQFKVQLEADKLVNRRDDEMQDALEKAEKNGKFKLGLLRYTGNKPATRFYVPYWDMDESNLSTDLTKGPENYKTIQKKALVTDGVIYLWLFVSGTTTGSMGQSRAYKLWVRFGVLGPMGDDLLGYDFFTGKKLNIRPDPDSPRDVSKFLYNQNWGSPAMYCMGCDIVSFSPVDRQSYQWTDDSNQSDLSKMNLDKMVLRKKRNTKSDDVSTTLIKGRTTGNNGCSIACMVIWPDSSQAKVSHYFAGDSGDQEEEQFLRWATVETTPGSGIREPIRIDTIKLSHHGAKFSTPARMFYLWRPSVIVVSNSMNSSWKHPAWELVACTWLYWHWRKKVLRAHRRILYATNFPIYLVRWYQEKKRRTAGVSIGSLASLDTPNADEFFDLWDNLKKRRVIPKKTINPRKMKGDEERIKIALARKTAQNWDEVSYITKGQYTGRAGNKWPTMEQSEKQRIRVILIMQEKTARAVYRFPADTMSELAPTMKRLSSFTKMSEAMRQLPKTLGRDETQGDAVSENRSHRTPIPQELAGVKTIENIIKDDEISEKLTRSNVSTFRDLAAPMVIFQPQGHNSVKDLQLGLFLSAATTSEASPNVAGLYFLTASDTNINSKITKYSVTEGHLDRFIGDLDTGAIVLAAEPPFETANPLPMTPLHETDESFEWLIFCLGSRDDPQCALRAGAAVTSNKSVNIMGFELETKLKYVGDDPSMPSSSPFFDRLVKFSTMRNGHAFDITGTRWPIMSANVGDADAVGPAHIVCMSLEESPGPLGSTVKVSEILSMFNFTSNEFLLRLANVADLELDPAKGAKNSIWYTPAEKHETTLRLCFKQSSTQGVSLLDTVKGVINTVTGVTANTPPQMSIEPRLIVKKTWALPYEDDVDVEIRKAVTVLLELEFPGKNRTMQLETALTFKEDKVEFVLNFKQGDSFLDILSFIANIFGVDTLATDIKKYLPQLDDIMVRQVTYTHETDVQAIEVVLQVNFGGMIMLCTLHVDILAGGNNLKFSGSLFAESRTPHLGDDFFWVPYSSYVEPWTVLEIAPVVNSAGLLEEVPATEVGDLSKAFNALRSNDQDPLKTSPTSLELVGLNFALSQEEVLFSATVMSDAPNEEGVPAIKLLAASLDLRYDIKAGKVSNCSLATSLPLISPVPGIPPAVCNLSLTFNNPTWTLKGGLQGVRGSLLYSLFDQSSNEEMVQLLSNVILSLQLTYEYDGNAKASSFIAEGILRLGKLVFGVTYNYPKTREWTFAASLNVLKDDETEKEDSLLSVIGSLCGKELTEIVPDFVGKISVKPVGNTDLSSLKVVKLEKAILVLVRLQITATTSIAFYQYQHKRENTSAKAPAVKRALVFSLSQLPSVDKIPLIGSIKQPFDEARFMWIGGGDDKGWKRKEVQVLNDKLNDEAKLGKDYPRMIFKNPGQQGQASSSRIHTSAADDDIVLRGGFHLCLIQNGEIRLDHVFGVKKAGEKDVSSNDGEDDDSFGSRATTSPMNKTMGPVTITGIGVAVDVDGEKLKIIIDGTVKLGPIDLTLIGFSLDFDLKGVTLTTLEKIKLPTFNLAGLAVGFQKDPITIAGLFERQITPGSDLYLGGAIIGFKEWRLEAGGYYGKSKAPPKSKSLSNFRTLEEEEFKAFLAYFRVSGPIATIGYAEIRGVVGGFGYNTSVRIPTMQDVQDFPFLAQKQEATPSKALEKMLAGGWFSNKQGQNWVAAGMTILAFQMLTVSAVVLVEWGSGVKLGIFGLATAEMPKHLPKKFAVVQLGVVATVDFDAGTMKVDGQLTPASFVLDPSCHLTGGFALYAWFGPGTQQGDWVFTIGGYHPSYHKPEPYPNPPRLGINWSYNSSINITGGAYFTITPKMIMGGGSLHVTLSLGSLYAYLDAFADFLINYQPFMYRASGGITVGVHYTLDLWLVSIPINVNLGAVITFQGPPLSGQVYVNFYVFAFRVEFGTQQSEKNDPIGLLEFEKLVRQTTPKPKAGMITDDLGNQDEDPLAPPHILNCISGLVPNGSEPPKPESPWVVRGAIFAFTVSCKFAIQTANIITLREQDGELVPDHTEPVKNGAAGKVCAKPMQRNQALGQSFLEVSITPPPLRPTMDEVKPQATNPAWKKYDVGYSNLPTALWGEYRESQDPAKPGNDSSAILNNSSAGTTQLLTSLTLYSPPSLRAEVSIARFNVAKSMGLNAGKRDTFPPVVPYHDKWLPLPTKADPEDQYSDLKVAWEKENSPVRAAARFMANLGLGGWEWPAAASEKEDEGIKIPQRFIGEMKQWWIEPPVLCT